MPLCRLDHEPRHGRRVCEVRARDRERRASAGSPCDLISDVDVALGQPVRLASRWRDLQVVEAASKSQGGRLERGLAQDCGAVGSEGSRLLITLGRKPRTPVSWPSPDRAGRGTQLGQDCGVSRPLPEPACELYNR